MRRAPRRSDNIDAYSLFLEKYREFTEIQKKAIPIIEAGSNAIIIAPTGAGKTEAAVLPLLKHICQSADKGDRPAGICVLYITPLRALNRDMIGRLESMCRALDISIAVRHGDTTQSERSRQARNAPQLLITTPETLQSILPTKYLGMALKNLGAVVIDEIHELYHNKRGAQLSLALERLERFSPGFQRIGISATVSDSEVIGRFLCGKRRCEAAISGAQKSMRIMVTLPKHHEMKLDSVADRFGLDNEALARLGTIADCVSKYNSVLIFANTRQIVEALGSRLLYINSVRGFGGIGVHHSSLDRDGRIEIEDSFKRGELKSIIATSSLELGIDIGKIDMVIQYGSPRQALRLVQRVGRSGHSERRTAEGIVVSTSIIDAIEAVSVSANAVSGKLEGFNIQKNALDVLANQICGIALDCGSLGLECTMDSVAKSVRMSNAYETLGDEDLESLFKFMAQQHMVRIDGNIIIGSPRTRMFYYDHLSVIQDTKRYIVRNMLDNRIISSLDDKFVSGSIDEGSVFITKGLPWRVISIEEDTVMVEPSGDFEAAIPDWSGEDIPVSGLVAGGVASIIDRPSATAVAGIADPQTGAAISEFVHKQQKYWRPDGNVVIERSGDYTAIYTWLGTLANDALSKLISHHVTLRLGHSINIKTSPYVIFIELGAESKIDLEHMLSSLTPGNIEHVLATVAQETELFRYKFIAVAKLFGVIDREAMVSKSLVKRMMKLLKDSPIYKETERELMKNYFDIDGLRAFLTSMASGKIGIRLLDLPRMSNLTEAIISSAYYTKELVLPLTPDSEIIKSFAGSILSKSIKLQCTYCGFSFSRNVADIKDYTKIACPSCKSPMITGYDEAYDAIIKKRAAGKRLTAGESAVLRDALKEASLFESYGGKAAVALSTYGVGVKGAARALMMLRRDERLFYIDLLELQRNFIRTKKYWAV